MRLKSNRNCEVEKSIIKQLKEENKQLKLKISKLEKVVSRINPEDIRTKNVKELKKKFETVQKNEDLCLHCEQKIIKIKVPSSNGVREIIRCTNSICLLNHKQEMDA